jgi:hypothetical protein
MQNPMVLSLWLCVALYAAIGLFGVIIFHDAVPTMQDATSGYGISIGGAATAPESRK